MAAAVALKFITLPAVRKHTATVIFLHVRPPVQANATLLLVNSSNTIKSGLR
jgi:hypothetical protein